MKIFLMGCTNKCSQQIKETCSSSLFGASEITLQEPRLVLGFSERH